MATLNGLNDGTNLDDARRADGQNRVGEQRSA